MRNIAIALAAFLSLWARLLAQPDADIDLYPQSVSTVNDVSAGIINPAALAPEYVIGFRYLHAFPDSTLKGDDGFIFGMRGALVSVQWLKHTNNVFRRKYLLAGGNRMFPNFYWGISYSWFGGNKDIYRNKRVWKSGILYRPAPIVSLGLVVDDINRPIIGEQRLERLYTLGAGLRPFGEKITFSADGSVRENQPLEKSRFVFRIEAMPKAGISLVTSYRTDGIIRAGITFTIEQSSIGVSSGYRESGFAGGTIYYNQGPVVTSGAMISRGKIASLRIGRNLSHEPRAKKLFGRQEIAFQNLLLGIRKAAHDPQIKGLLVELDDFPLGFASAWELRRALGEFKSSGRKVVVYLGSPGNIEYYVASLADQIYMPPVGLLELNGLRAEMLHLKGTLDKLGIEAEFISTGKFKTAGDILTRDNISEGDSIQINALLDDIYEIMVSDIAVGRGITENEVRQIIDEGPYGASRALSRRLVSGLCYPDEIKENPERYFGEKYRFTELFAELGKTQVSNYWGDPAHIAIINATGEMTGRTNRESPLVGKIMGSKTIADAVKKAAKDRRVVAVVLRIDSPGGEAETADAIYHELEKLKGKKPLIVSMADVCASGGYYIGCIGDEIVVPEPTITGSIGVIDGKIVTQGLYRKIGANKTIIKRGRHADIRSSWRKLDDEERQLATSEIMWLYDEFKSKVSRWRNMTPAGVDSIAQGRVWSGRDALDIGLASREGGLLEAIDIARARAGIGAERPVKYDVYPRYGFKLSLGMSGFEGDLTALGLDRISLPAWLLSESESAAYYRLPININIK